VRDNDSNVTSVADDGVQAGPVYSTTFDAVSRPYDETVKYLPGGDRILQHRYDRFGNRNQLTLQDGTAAVNTYTYNKLNELASANLASGAIALTYYANDDRQTVTLPNGVSHGYTYKTNGPIDTITVNGPSSQLAQYAYAYDDVLNAVTYTDADGIHSYGYDGLNRLTQATRPVPSGLPNENYTYDRVGNRKDPANLAQWTYDNNNRISQAGTLTYTFDTDGSLATRSDAATFTHDARSRLVQYVKGGTSAAYLYDPLGRRIEKTVNGTTTWFLWDGTRLLAEYNSIGTRMQRYGYLAGDFVATQMQDTNGTYYVHADNLQAPRILTNSSAQIVWRARYQAYGTTAVNNDVDSDGVAITYNQRFPGQYADVESGLFYNYFRNYDPVVGRFVQDDPLGLVAGNNLYAYVGSNPFGYVDPYGLWSWQGAAWGALSGGIEGAVGGAIGGAIAGGGAGAIPGAVLGGLLGALGGGIAGGLDAHGGVAGAGAGAIGGAVGGAAGGWPGAVGGAVGGAMAGTLGSSGTVDGAMVGGAAGTVAGGIAGAVEGGVKGGVIGAVVGGLAGAIGGGIGGANAANAGNVAEGC
jgi:RHS repeat-associated protein